MASALRIFVRTMELLWVGSNRLLRPQNTSHSDMGDMLGELVVGLERVFAQRGNSYPLNQPRSLLRCQRGQGLTCTHPCNL
jgi:hypothetical protein